MLESKHKESTTNQIGTHQPTRLHTDTHEKVLQRGRLAWLENDNIKAAYYLSRLYKTVHLITIAYSN